MRHTPTMPSLLRTTNQPNLPAIFKSKSVVVPTNCTSNEGETTGMI